MDQILAMRLTESSRNYDPNLYSRLAKLGKDYRTAGTQNLDYFTPDMDWCNDAVNCFTSRSRADFERDRLAPENFRHPMTATEVTTLTTFVSQILFGGETSRRVQPRKPDDEPKADIINELLGWNDNQQPTYNQGFYWVWDSVTFNRGVMYDHWADLLEVTLEAVEEEIPFDEPKFDEQTKRKITKPRGYKGGTSTRFRKVRRPIGGFVKVNNIDPYDFICDPTVPMSRFQEGRFAGHRVVLTWQELERRSKLPVDHYEYVLPDVVKKLKSGKGRPNGGMPSGTRSTALMSRTAYERSRRATPGTLTTGTSKINKEDGGVVECWCIQIRTAPATYDIFPEDEELELVEVLLAGDSDLLSVNVMTNKHDQYPYAVGEARPNAHRQFGPSWVLIIKGPQDYVDYLKNRHKESLARTTGNIFMGHADMVDFDAFTDPSKDGLFIPLTEAAKGKSFDQILKQIPITDTTSNFHDEMMMWINQAEQATGAHAAVQGQTEDPSQTATQFVGVQQMAQGRVSTVARLLSAGALMGQTQRIVENLQQFLPDATVIRITGENESFDPNKPPVRFRTVIRDRNEAELQNEDGTPTIAGEILSKNPDHPDIQGNFDVVVSDGSLPGTDAKKVAALSRAVEAFSSNPQLAAIVFDETRPGAVNILKTFEKLLKATGFPSSGLLITAKEAEENARKRLMAQGGGMGMPVAALGTAEPVPPVDTGAGNIPSAEALPPAPPAAPPAPGPQSV